MFLTEEIQQKKVNIKNCYKRKENTMLNFIISINKIIKVRKIILLKKTNKKNKIKMNKKIQK